MKVPTLGFGRQAVAFEMAAASYAPICNRGGHYGRGMRVAFTVE